MFTENQIEQLLKNKNVLRCTKKSITYGKKFKIDAINLYQQGLTSNEVFRQLGFNLDIIGRDRPKKSINRWKNLIKTKGINGLLGYRRNHGGRPKTKNFSDKEKIKYLEARVAYLKEENDFLAKIRAKRAE